MAVQFRDYYETLGVSKTASEDEIRSAFRKLARKYHPDVAKDKKTAEEKFKQINEAYEVLSDPEKRRKYDQLGENWNQPGGFQPPPQWGGGQPGGFRWGSGENGGVEFEFGGTGFSDFFEAFFGGGRGRSAFGGFGQRGTMAERGSDVEADIMVTLEEALHGSTRQVSLRRAGSKKTETYQVKIPRGVREGQRIRRGRRARWKERRFVFAGATGAAPRFFGRGQRSCARGEDCAMAGDPGRSTHRADAGGKRSFEITARHTRRSAFSFAGARVAGRFGPAR